MSTGVIEVSGLRKSYGSLVAVDNLEMSVPKGAVFGLLGPNGAGKSTTFGVLCGFLKADQGRATILGMPAQELYRLRGRVAVLPQDAAFPPQVSVLRQLTYFGELQGLTSQQAQREAQEALGRVGLSDAANKRGNELSHGMHKRVGLAQALIGAPEVVMLDEPTAGLDPVNARHVKDLIASLAPRATVVVSSHNLVEIQEICTHGAILDKGRRVAYGSIYELTQQGTLITIELEPGASAPVAALESTLKQVHYAQDTGLLTLNAPKDAKVSEVIQKTLRILLDANAPILSVKRGTSLETAFLEATKAS